MKFYVYIFFTLKQYHKTLYPIPSLKIKMDWISSFSYFKKSPLNDLTIKNL